VRRVLLLKKAAYKFMKPGVFFLFWFSVTIGEHDFNCLIEDFKITQANSKLIISLCPLRPLRLI
jgi:hypothetical protein